MNRYDSYEDGKDLFKKNFNGEVDTIFEKYGNDFFANPDHDFEFPESPKERYELFKDSTAKYHFYNIKWAYLNQAAKDDDGDSIKAELLELERIIRHDRMSNEIEQLKLFRAAKEYFASAKVFGPIEGKDAGYTDEVTLYIYMLHYKGYFNNYLLPDKAFDIDKTTNNLNFIGEVYGEYFLFYEYLLEQATKLGIEINISLDIKKVQEIAREKPKSKKQLTKQKTLRDIWEGSPKEWNLVIAYLQNDYDSLPFITTKKNGDYNWTRVGRKPYQKFLAGFLRVCVEYGYILNEYTGGEMVNICCNTFKNLNGLERNNFTNLQDFSAIDTYQKPFLKIPKMKVEK